MFSHFFFSNETPQHFKEFEGEIQRDFNKGVDELLEELEEIQENYFAFPTNCGTSLLLKKSINLLEAFKAAHSWNKDSSDIIETIKKHFRSEKEDLRLIIKWSKEKGTVPGDISMLRALPENAEEEIIDEKKFSIRTQIFTALTLLNLYYLVYGKYQLANHISRETERELLSWGGVMLTLLIISSMVSGTIDDIEKEKNKDPWK